MRKLTVVTSNNTAIFRELRSPSFKALHPRHLVVTTGPEALETIRQSKPHLAVLDVDLPEMGGCDVCREVKRDPELRETRIILVVTGGLSPPDVDRLSASGCDDILTIPTPAEDLYSHAARLLPLPQQQQSRVRAQVLMPEGSRMPVVRGQVTDISLTAIEVAVEQTVDAGTEVRLRLARTGSGQALLLRGSVTSCDHDPATSMRTLRVKLSGLRPEDERALADLALWEVLDRGNGCLVLLRGDITERTDFDPLLSRLSDLEISFELSGVRYLNSAGMRRWVDFLDRIDGEATYQFVRCSVAFVTQLGMVARARGRGHVVSFMAPYVCDMCDRETEQLLQTLSLRTDQEGEVVPPAFDCSQCGGPLELDEMPARFFAFMQPER